MFSSEQYRAKAAEYLKLAANTDSPNEVREFGDLDAAIPCWLTTKNGWSIISTRWCTHRAKTGLKATRSPRKRSSSALSRSCGYYAVE